MALKFPAMLKALLCGLLFAVPVVVIADALNFVRGGQFSVLVIQLLGFAGFLLGGVLSKYVSWAWLLGGLLGALTGFYGLLLFLAFLWNDRSYEEGLGYLLVSASFGMFLGGYWLSLVRRARGKR